MTTVLIKKMAQLIWNKQLSLISGPWYSIGLGISGRVLRTQNLTWPGRVFVPPLGTSAESQSGYLILQCYLVILLARLEGQADRYCTSCKLLHG